MISNRSDMMRKMLSVFGVGFLLVAGFAGAADAGTYVWKDNTDGFTISFPDSWRVQTVDVPSTRLRIAGPIAEDAATCRVKAEKDGRLKIYPKRLMATAVSETLDRKFWENEVSQYEDASVLAFYAPASLGGQGDATAIRTSFVQDNGSGKADMFGEMIGSIYADTRYVVSCTSKAGEFKKYAPVFLSIMDSLELSPKYHPFAVGYYRDFLMDAESVGMHYPLKLPRSKPGTIDP